MNAFVKDRELLKNVKYCLYNYILRRVIQPLPFIYSEMFSIEINVHKSNLNDVQK